MIDYTLIRSGRKTLAIEVREEGQVIVRAPQRCPVPQIEAFLDEKEDWIKSRCARQRERAARSDKERVLTEKERLLYREKAKEIFRERTAYYAALMKVSYARITVREQKTRWGSCSSAGNLNFNWKLVLAPAGVLDYVVVHELAHRKQMNHSRAFWSEVEKVMPRYRKYRNWLKENGALLLKISIHPR